jgi:bifunctional UDP-N-acetylglucosamine pyrophosphorylase/glucosamine-1-phosphate N-acetyltransferase
MAAGKGTRMKSRLPKVLQRLAHVPLVQHVLTTAQQLQARSAVVITGHGADQVEAALTDKGGALALKFVRQEPNSALATPCSRHCPCWETTAWWWCSRATCR